VLHRLGLHATKAVICLQDGRMIGFNRIHFIFPI
jgi:hypothetical protein